MGITHGLWFRRVRSVCATIVFVWIQVSNPCG